MNSRLQPSGAARSPEQGDTLTFSGAKSSRAEKVHRVGQRFKPSRIIFDHTTCPLDPSPIFSQRFCTKSTTSTSPNTIGAASPSVFPELTHIPSLFPMEVFQKVQARTQKPDKSLRASLQFTGQRKREGDRQRDKDRDREKHRKTEMDREKKDTETQEKDTETE